MAVSPPPTGTSNAELVRWSFGALNAHDVAAMRELWTADTVERFPARTVRGTDAIAAYFKEIFAAMPDFHLEIVGLAESGDDVFVQWHLTGTHSGAPFEGIDATGRAVALDGMDHFVVRDGKVVSNFVVYDQMQFARAIGLLPDDGTAADRATKAAFNAKTRLVDKVRSIRNRE